MAKVPKFMQKILSSNKVKSDKAQEKLQGQSVLYAGDPSLHWATGGWVRGRDNLIYGIFGSGKSTLALMGAGQEQKITGGAVVIFDTEYSYKDHNQVNEDGNPTEEALEARTRLAQAGLDWEKVIIKQSNQVDVLFEDLEDIKADLKEDSSCISAIIVDSWGGMQGENSRKAIAKGEISAAGNQFGGNAKLSKPILHELLRLAAEHTITTFFIQHAMKSMEMYGPKYLLLGGEALKFLVHNILFLESVNAKDATLMEGGIATTKDGDNAGLKVGKKIRFLCEKSRQNVEGRKGTFFFDFDKMKFALPEVSLFDLATNLGVIAHPNVLIYEDDGVTPKIDKKTGLQAAKTNNMWYEYPAGSANPVKFHGEKGTIQALKDDKDLFNRVYQSCLKSEKKDATTQTDEVVEAVRPKKGKK